MANGPVSQKQSEIFQMKVSSIKIQVSGSCDINSFNKVDQKSRPEIHKFPFKLGPEKLHQKILIGIVLLVLALFLLTCIVDGNSSYW